MKKTSAQSMHKTHAKKNSLLGNTRDMSEGRVIQNKLFLVLKKKINSIKALEELRFTI